MHANNSSDITSSFSPHSMAESIKGRPVHEVLEETGLDGNGTLTQQVYRLLRTLAVEMRLMPNQAVSESDIASCLHISKTPVREAFIRLSEDGVVVIVPKSGTYIAPIDVGRAFEGYFVRCSLEASCAERLASVTTPEVISVLRNELAEQRRALDNEDFKLFYQLDNRFHETLFFSAGLQHTKRLLDSAKFEVDRIRSLRLVFRIRRVEEVLAEHSAIVDAVEKRDGTAARLAAANHFSGLSHSIETLAKGEEFWSLFNHLNGAGKTGRRAKQISPARNDS